LTIPKVERVICSSYFSYAKGFNENQYYSWGFGSGFVLGNGKEDSLFISNKVNNE
jgi:alpha-tubulin suppressor-like RCC1 family protein